MPAVQASDSTGRAAARWPTLVLEAAAAAAVLACLVLAAVWYARHPVINAYDETGHLRHTLSDALMLRQGELATLRDSLFLWNRWLPPGLRVVGLPIALAAGEQATAALRLSGGFMFILTIGALWMALRPLGGRAGAAAGVILYAVSPVNLYGAQNFMTEAVLHLCAALALWLLVAEARAARTSVFRMGALGLVLGLGTLTKLTFLPAFGLIWGGLSLYRWWRDRDGGALAVRLLLPAVGLLAVAWPHYVVNGTRYLGYAKATAQGFAFGVWPETGIAFAARAARSLVADVLGPAGAVALALGLVLVPFAWRRADEPQRLVAALAALGSVPTLLAFFGSSNQTDRYLGMSIIGFSAVIALGVGGALRAVPPWRPARAAAAAIGAATLAQVAWASLIAWQGPSGAWPAAGLDAASWRENTHCEYSELVSVAPPVAAGPTNVGVFGTNKRVNNSTMALAFLKAGRRVASNAFGMYEEEIDWDAVVAEAAAYDVLVMPKSLEARDVFPINRYIPEFEGRLTGAGVVIERTLDLAGGPVPECAIRVLVPKRGTGPRPPRGPVRSEVNTLP